MLTARPRTRLKGQATMLPNHEITPCRAIVEGKPALVGRELYRDGHFAILRCHDIEFPALPARLATEQASPSLG